MNTKEKICKTGTKLLALFCMMAVALPSVCGPGPKFPRRAKGSKVTPAATQEAVKNAIKKAQASAKTPITHSVSGATPIPNSTTILNNVAKKARQQTAAKPGERGLPSPIESITAESLSKKESFEFYLLTLPNLFFHPDSSSFVMRMEQIEEADKFYKQFLKGPNIYGEFVSHLSKFYLHVLTDSHIRWAEVLYAFTGLSLLGQPGAGDAIVDASLRCPLRRQPLNDYIALHALLLLEDWPALQRFINVRSAAGYGAFVELREYLAHVVPEAPISFPKKTINEELYPFHRIYHYPTFQEQLQLMDKYGNNFLAEGLERFADYIQGEKDENYLLLSEYPLSSFVTGKRREFELGEVARDYKRGKIFVENNEKYGAFKGLMDNFEIYGVQEEDLVEKNNNSFLKCISYEAGITANMACIREKLHRPIIYTPEPK